MRGKAVLLVLCNYQCFKVGMEGGAKGGDVIFSKTFLSNYLPATKSIQSNIEKVFIMIGTTAYGARVF